MRPGCWAEPPRPAEYVAGCDRRRHHRQVATDAAGGPLGDCWETLAAADWERAQACFEHAADERGETAEVLDGLSQAVHFQGDYDRAIELMERAFAEYRRRGERIGAVRPARWLAFLHGSVHGNLAVANGWMARAESLLEGVEECAEHGWLVLDRAPWTQDAAERQGHALAAIEIARRFGDRDLEFSALALLGHTYVASGRVAEGMKLLDEALAAVSGGEVVGIPSIGEIYCRLLSACERAGDLRRAEEWMSVAGRFVAWEGFVPPTCRMHYGGILIAIGRWAEAERELLYAIRVFEGGYRAERSLPLLRLAELRLRQGRLDEAERLLDGCEWHPTAKRVLAATALTRGDTALARALAQAGLETADLTEPAAVPLLELSIDVALADGEVDVAREHAEQLARIARTSGDKRAAAGAELAAGLTGAEGVAARLRSAAARF
jgi:tetratricopeptide (TPR) repeat protein